MTGTTPHAPIIAKARAQEFVGLGLGLGLGLALGLGLGLGLGILVKSTEVPGWRHAVCTW